MSGVAYFHGGTIVLNEVDDAPPPFQWIKQHWRCEAYHYPQMVPWLREHNIRDTVPRWEKLALTLHDPRTPHDYQRAAVQAWDDAGQQGSIVLPTGAGKTFVAIRAIHQVKRSAVVVAPTIDLLHQWYARLGNAFQQEIGVYYGAEKLIKPLTVTTYHSAGDLMADYGHHFKLLIFDEVHHLSAPHWGEIALMSPAPARLGLTATYPHDAPLGRWKVEDLIGSVVYQLHIDDLAGERLAEYRTERIRIDLTPEERAQYDADWKIYSDFFQARRLREKFGPNWLAEFNRLSAIETEARRAFLARQRLTRLLATASGKMTALENLLREYGHESSLIFTEHNAAAYHIAERFLIPVITHETKAAERKHILQAFQSGYYRAIVTSKVLNEGIDVPEAKIAIVLGGTASAREYIQRLGRVLRKSGNRQALLFEVIARKTAEENKAQARRQGVKDYVNR